jgi:hypothetical protein
MVLSARLNDGDGPLVFRELGTHLVDNRRSGCPATKHQQTFHWLRLLGRRCSWIIHNDIVGRQQWTA